ncbi:protein GAST1-like [Nymphaea colorata]|nr:protein GAST1-like [Nymphaea colorata]
MAMRQVSLLCLVLLLLLSWESNADSGTALKSEAASLDMYGARQGSLHPQECTPRCNIRCSATAYKKACLFFCEKCCATCLCVPPGTYGNKQVCPCYNNWKTKRGGPKCP